MTARWGTPAEGRAVLESTSWSSTLLLVVLLLALVAGLGAGVAG